PELQRSGLGHFVGAGLIGRSIGLPLRALDEAVRQKIGLNFVTTDVGEHFAVNLHARTEHLAALFDHLLALRRVVDHIAVFIRQVVFAEDRADALAPAAGRFEISNYLWFVHKSETQGQGAIAWEKFKAKV